ncbi:hypothetical protein GUJ93_ZPchr0009g323 [Zizania palustris]|uniref:Uncharacterized protein n=1 Tax=Zizania palustris TaxID=103762 RepID=A0A8J5S0F5_ZIZPA|nr:hypothetical protein GUJ93_ZPchr0009g323 [Zizania palustris]
MSLSLVLPHLPYVSLHGTAPAPTLTQHHLAPTSTAPPNTAPAPTSTQHHLAPTSTAPPSTTLCPCLVSPVHLSLKQGKKEGENKEKRKIYG